jgi:hypothetical protein
MIELYRRREAMVNRESHSRLRLSATRELTVNGCWGTPDSISG